MFTADAAPRNEGGCLCPVCGRQDLRADEMAHGWSPAAWGYVPVVCLECQERAHRHYLAALEAEAEPHATALLSEAALAEEWNRPEEDAAWSAFQPPQS